MAKLSLLIWSTLLLVFFIALSESSHGRQNVDSLEPPILDDLFDRLASSNNKDDCHLSQPSRHTEPRRRNRFPLRPTRLRTRHYPRPIEPPRNLVDPNRVLVSLPNDYQKEDSSTVHKAGLPKKEKDLIKLNQWVILNKDNGKESFGELSEVEQIFERAKSEHLPHYYKNIPEVSVGRSQMALKSGKRELVTSAELSEDPYSTIGLISIRCTGTFIGPRHVVTAAHCLYDSSKKKWSLESEDRFYRKKGCDPDLGVEYDWEMAIVPKGWYQSSKWEFDYAMIIVKDLVQFTTDLSNIPPPTMNFGWEDDATVKEGMSVSIVGYPDDKEGFCMWKDTSPLCIMRESGQAPPEYTLKHECDTQPGNSGGPVYSSVRGVQTLQCIHSHVVGNRKNFCTRINKVLFLTLSHWIETIRGEKDGLEWITKRNDVEKTVSVANPSDVKKLLDFIKDRNLPETFQESPVQKEDVSSFNPVRSQGLEKRKLVTKNEDPYSAIAMVTNNFPRKCTGTLIGPKHVLTAASCLYDSKTNTWLDGFKVNFLHKANKDLGSEYEWEMVIVPHKYVERKQLSMYSLHMTELDKYDFGMIVLKNPVLKTPTLNFGWDTDQKIKFQVMEADLVGYPGGDTQDSMLEGRCMLLDAEKISPQMANYILEHECSADLGDSGAPLIEFADNPMKRVFKCIQKMIEGEPNRYCLRITRAVFASLAYWIKLYH